MDSLIEAAKAYANLFDKDYVYMLETNVTLQVYFVPDFFHHLIGLQKLVDIPQVMKGYQNNARYIFKNIISGIITLDDLCKSRYFNDMEARLRHFSQINTLVEFEKIIIEFNPSLISSKIDKADYILFKQSNDNMYLNLFLKEDSANKNKQIPLTFIPCPNDYYTYGQKVINILSMTRRERTGKKNK